MRIDVENLSGVLPAFCPHCGHLFTSTVLGIPPGMDIPVVVIENVPETCPRCHLQARVVDGTYEIVDSAIRMVTELRDPEVLRRLFAIFKEAERTQDLGRVERRIAEEAPEASRIMALLRDPAVGNVGVLITILLTVIMLIQARGEHDSGAPGVVPTPGVQAPEGPPDRHTVGGQQEGANDGRP